VNYHSYIETIVKQEKINMPDFSFLEYFDNLNQDKDISYVLADYLKYVANRRLRIYKGREYIHTEGDKRGKVSIHM